MGIPENARKVYTGNIFTVYEWDQEMFDGSIEIFERILSLPIVKLLCVTEDGKIIINQEEQPGKNIFLSLPWGRLEDWETLDQWARRELLEETGYEPQSDLELLSEYEVGYRLNLTVYLYIARNLIYTTQPKLDPGEKIQIKTVSIDECIELALSEKLFPKSFQQFILREHYRDPTFTAFKQKILGNT